MGKLLRHILPNLRTFRNILPQKPPHWLRNIRFIKSFWQNLATYNSWTAKFVGFWRSHYSVPSKLPFKSHIQSFIGTQSSDLHVQKKGVTQGAILSPTLFLIRVESLFRPMPSNIKYFMYADDIVLDSASNNRTESRTSLQEGVNIVQKWSRWTGYTISHSKSKILQNLQ